MSVSQKVTMASSAQRVANLTLSDLNSAIQSICNEMQQEIVADFSDLPELIWIKVLNMLDLRDRYHMSVTCRKLQHIVSLPSVWKLVLLDLSQEQDRGFRDEGYLSPFQQLLVKKFGHLFQHVEVTTSFFDLRPDSYSILTSLGEQNLKSLTLSTHEENHIFDDCSLKNTKPNLSVLMDGLCQKLPYVHLNVEITEGDASYETVLESMLKCSNTDSRCKHLQSLNIAAFVFSKMDIAYWGKEFKSDAPIALLVSKFPSLQHLHLNVFILSDALLRELSDPSRQCSLRSLTVEFDGELNEKYLPQLSSDSWKQLVSSCPQMEVWCKINTEEQWSLKKVLKPEVPLVGLRIFCGGEDGQSEAVLVCSEYSHMLRSFEYVIEDMFGFIQGEWDRLPLEYLVKKCSKLQHLTYGGYIHQQNIVNLAVLDRQWRTFQFQQNRILVDDDSVPGQRVRLSDLPEVSQKKILNEICQTVSRHVGYTWKPSIAERKAF